MTKHQFEVDGRYRNKHGEYEVLGIDGEQMLVSYDDGKQQAVSLVCTQPTTLSDSFAKFAGDGK